MPAELEVMAAPVRGYARLARSRTAVPAPTALRRPAIVALVIGTALTVSATGAADGRTVLTTSLSWAWVPVLQVVIAIPLIANAGAIAVHRADALDLFFAGHAPWSLWLLASAAWAALTGDTLQNFNPVLLTALVPLIWTPVIVYGFCRSVLRRTKRAAVLSTVAHQVVTWTIGVAYFGWAVQLWPRIVGLSS